MADKRGKMFPVLFEIGSFKMPTYGPVMISGLLVGTYFGCRKASAAGLNPYKYAEAIFWGFLASFLGCYVFFILLQLDEIIAHPGEMLNLKRSANIFYIGFIFAFSTFIYVTHRNKLPVLHSLDMLAISAAIGHFIGRIGCFAAGCCHGKPVDPDFPLAVTFTHAQSLAPKGIPLHPAQLYDAFNLAIVITILHFLYHRKKFDGQVFAVYVMVYAVGRYIVEFFRGDRVRGFVIEDVLSTSQFIGILFFLLALAGYLYLHRRKKAAL